MRKQKKSERTDSVLALREGTGGRGVTVPRHRHGEIAIRFAVLLYAFAGISSHQIPKVMQLAGLLWNGITDDMVADAPSFEPVLKAFMDFAGDMVLVGHNIHSFDMKFICRDSEVFFGQTVGNNYIDTLFIARKCLPALPHHTLTDLAGYYSISTRGAHRALNDCRMNQQVFEKLMMEESASPQAPEEERICPKCGSELKLRSGRFGEFWGCTGYPACRYTENK